MPATGSFSHDSPGLQGVAQLPAPPSWEQLHHDQEWSALFWGWWTQYRPDADVEFWQGAGYLAYESRGDTVGFLAALHELYPSENWSRGACQLIADAAAVFQEDELPDWPSLPGPELVAAISGTAERHPDKSPDYTDKIQELWTVQIAELLASFHEYCQQLAASSPIAAKAVVTEPVAPEAGVTESVAPAAVAPRGMSEFPETTTLDTDPSDTMEIAEIADALKITEEELIEIVLDEEQRTRLIAALLKDD